MEHSPVQNPWSGPRQADRDDIEFDCGLRLDVSHAQTTVAMNPDGRKPSIWKLPSVYVPLLMSLAALTLVLLHFALYGAVHEADEGAAAHTWQVLMAAQVPFVVYLLARWLPKRPREALLVLGRLAATWLANLAAVYWLT